MSKTPEKMFTGEMLYIDPAKPFRMEVVIDNADGGDYPDNPFTLNAAVGFAPAHMVELVLNGEGCIIDGDVPTQLRTLADLIERGQVTR